MMNRTYPPMIILIVVLYSAINITYSIDCSGPGTDQPCKCYLDRIECPEAPKCEWIFSKCISGTGSPTTSPTPEPSERPTSGLSIECGEIVRDKWRNHAITFKFEILNDIKSININACNSNINTMLKLYENEQISSIPIYVNDDGCINNYASLINIDNGLNVGTYYLLLTTDPMQQDGEYEISITCGDALDALHHESRDPTPRPSRSPTPQFIETVISDNINTKNPTERPSRSPLDGDNIWWSPTPRPTHFPFTDKTECGGDCDAFRVELLYYGKLSDYNTEYIYYDTVNDGDSNPRRLVILNNDDIGCYTYKVSRIFNDGICKAKVTSLVLGACHTDYNRVNYADLEALIVREYSGDIYKGFVSFGRREITGIKLDVVVDEEPIEFTLCMKGVNVDGFTSDFVRFKRGTQRSYICADKGNDGLPCLRDSFRNHHFIGGFNKIHNGIGAIAEDANIMTEHIVSSPKSSVFSRILFAILVIVLCVMLGVSIFYYFVSRGIFVFGKKLMNNDIDWGDWGEADFLDSVSSTDDVDGNDDDDDDDIDDIEGDEEETKEYDEKKEEEQESNIKKQANDAESVESKISSLEQDGSSKCSKSRKSSKSSKSSATIHEDREDDDYENMAEDIKVRLTAITLQFIEESKKIKDGDDELIPPRRHYRNINRKYSISSTLDENDGMTILPLYDEYDLTDNQYNDVYYENSCGNLSDHQFDQFLESHSHSDDDDDHNDDNIINVD